MVNLNRYEQIRFGAERQQLRRRLQRLRDNHRQRNEWMVHVLHYQEPSKQIFTVSCDSYDL